MIRLLLALLVSALLVGGAEAQLFPGYPPVNSFYVGNGRTSPPQWLAPAAAQTALGLATWAVPTGIVPVANGGTGVALTPSNGGIVYSGATTLALLSGTVTAGQCLLSGSSGAPTWGSCSGAAGAVSSVTNSDGSLAVSPTSGAVIASLNTVHANTWTGIQTYVNSGLRLLGSSTGFTTLANANTTATNFTLTLPAVTDTVAVLGSAQTFSAAETFSGTVNFTGPFQVGGVVMAWPTAPATVAALNLSNQLVSGGANVVSFSIGTVSSGTTTINCGNGQQQYLTNNGPFILAAPVTDGACNVTIINGTTAGVVTFSGFSVNAAFVGPTMAQTSGSRYVVAINRAFGFSIYIVVPQQ